MGLLRPLLAAATAPELSLGAYALGGGASALDGGQVVAAGWHAAAVAAQLCSGAGQAEVRLQDAVVARGLLPLLAQFVTAEAPAAGAAGAAAVGGGASVAERLMAVR